MVNVDPRNRVSQDPIQSKTIKAIFSSIIPKTASSNENSFDDGNRVFKKRPLDPKAEQYIQAEESKLKGESVIRLKMLLQQIGIATQFAVKKDLVRILAEANTVNLTGQDIEEVSMHILNVVLYKTIRCSGIMLIVGQNKSKRIIFCSKPKRSDNVFAIKFFEKKSRGV